MSAAEQYVAKQSTPPVPTTEASGKVVPVNHPYHHAPPIGQLRADAVPTTDGRFKVGKIVLFFHGLNMTMCGQTMGWNLGLSIGAGSFLVLYVVMGLAYVAFICCVAEVTSAMPFAGGSYGLARCTLGFFPAFLIGTAETLEYTMSAAVQGVSVTSIITRAAPALEEYKLLIALVVYYVPLATIQCIGGVSFWCASVCFSITQLSLLLLYCFGVLGDVNFSANAASETPLFAGDASGWMNFLPYMAWLYLGVEALNLAGADVRQPKLDIPRPQVACISVLFLTGLFVLLTTVSLPLEGGLPALSAELVPLDNGYMRMFSLDPSVVTLLTLPSQYVGGLGSSWAAGKLVYAMGSARLMPPWLGATSSRFGTPYAAIITMAIIGYGVSVLVQFQPSVTAYLVPLCLLFAFISYSGQCVGYISLKLRYPIMKQSAFKNPLGVYGALFALAVWAASIVGILGFQGHDGVEMAFFGVLLVVLGVYYTLVAKKRQIMSEEETKVLLVAHITRFNSKKRSKYSASQSKRSSGERKSVVSTGFLSSFRPSKANKPATSSTRAPTERNLTTANDRP